MTHSTSRHGDAAAPGDVAHTPTLLDGTLKAIAPMTSDTNLAGGINSGAEDMAKWVLTLLDSGKVGDGNRLYQPRTARRLQEPVTPMPNGMPPAAIAPLASDFRFYALGLDVSTFRGRKIPSHRRAPRLPVIGGMDSVGARGRRRAHQRRIGDVLALTWTLMDRVLRTAQPFDFIAGYDSLRAASR
ncbi:MAG: hypothetical protein IPN47_13050 [Gemmatimonadetes bacterium]|nr:hypothetical protein [Gemmatimonadota bacterium]